MASAFLGINGRVVRLNDVPTDPIVYAHDDEVEVKVLVENIKGKPGYAVVTKALVKVPGHEFVIDNNAVLVDGMAQEKGEPQSFVGGFSHYHIGAGSETRFDIRFNRWEVAILIADGTLPHLRTGVLSGVRHLGIFLDAKPETVAGFINE